MFIYVYIVVLRNAEIDYLQSHSIRWCSQFSAAKLFLTKQIVTWLYDGGVYS